MLQHIFLLSVPFFLVIFCSAVHLVLPLNGSLKKAQRFPVVYGILLEALTISMAMNYDININNSFFLANIPVALIAVLVIFMCQVMVLMQVLEKHRAGTPMKDIALSDIKSRYAFIYKDILHMPKDGEKVKQKYSDRLKRIIVPFVCLGFMYFIFSVYELYFSNTNEWKFLFKDILPVSLIFFAGTVLLAMVIAALFKGRKLDMIAIISGALCLLSYMQYAFLNSDNFVSGEKLNFSLLVIYANLLLWAGLPAALCIYYKKSGNKKMVAISSGVAAALIVIQGSTLPFLLMNGLPEKNEVTSSGYSLDGAEQFEVSSEENVIVFIMDTYYSGYFTDLLAEQPEYYTELSDFIFFDDVNSESIVTALSMPSILTAHSNDYSIPLTESYRLSWESDEAEFFYDSMHNAGYRTELYTDGDVYCGGAENMIGKIDNIKEYTYKYSTEKLPTFLKLASIGAYRYFPYWLKELVYVSDVRYVNMYTTSDSIYSNMDHSSWKSISASSSQRGIMYYNDEYYSALKKGLSVTDEKKCIFQHIHGMHEPYLSESSKTADYNGAINGCMTIFKEYINQLKQIGVYDNSTIILTADHGAPNVSEGSSVMLVKPAGRTAEKLVVNSAPGNVQTDLLPTILDCTGLDYAPLRYSLLDLEEDMSRTRYVGVPELNLSYPYIKKCSSYGYSVINCYYRYEFDSECSEVDEKINSYEIIPMTDYWW